MSDAGNSAQSLNGLTLLSGTPAATRKGEMNRLELANQIYLIEMWVNCLSGRWAASVKALRKGRNNGQMRRQKKLAIKLNNNTARPQKQERER